MGDGEDGKKPYLVTAALVGVLLIVGGVVMTMVVGGGIPFDNAQGEEIVAVDSFDEAQDKEVIVDIAGAVIKPGVYQLEPNARINDALVKAGGLSLEADRGWVSKNLNLAMKLIDGQKLYIPQENEAISLEQGPALSGLINVNSASVSELDTLWGVGEATAKKIIDGRPYGSIEELLTKKVIRSNVYEEIKDEVSVH